MLAVPSFIPNRLRGVSWPRVVEEVRPKPSWDQRMVTVPRPIRARLRIAWKTTWGSSAQAWTQMSPSDSRAFSSSPGSGGRGFSAGGFLAERPSPGRVEDRGPEAEGDRQVRGGQFERLAGVFGRRQLVVVARVVADHLALGHLA